MKKYFWLIAILILGAFLRLWQLGIIPVGVTHDELGYIYNSYTIAKTGSNVFGQHLPFLTWMTQSGFPSMPTTIYFVAPFFWIFPLSLTIGRLPSALLGITDIFLLYLLIYKLFKNKPFALLSALFLAISPWHIHFARSAYDTNFSLFFYLLGIVLFMYQEKRMYLVIGSLLSFLLAIFAYRGMSTIALPLLAALGIYGIYGLKLSKKYLMTFIIGCIVIFICFFGAIKVYGKLYVQEALFFQNPKLQETIDNESASAQGPLWLKRLYLNKPMTAAATFRENYIKSYSPEFLFLYTEPSRIYSVNGRGRLYFIDMIFIILGFIFIYQQNKKAAFFITSLFIIGGLPGGVGGIPYSARNFFLSIIFPILVGGGILWLYQQKLIKHFKKIFILLITCIYIFLLSSYLFDYYNQYAYYEAESWAKSLKDISSTINQKHAAFTHVVVGTSSFVDVVQYVFWTKLDPHIIQQIWEKRQQTTFSINNITFIPNCWGDEEGNIPPLKKGESSLYIVHTNCNKQLHPTEVMRDYFGNPVWNIYELH